MKRYWEIIADNLSKAGWSWGCFSAIDYNRRTLWIVDAHRDTGKRFVVRADEDALGLTRSRFIEDLAPAALLSQISATLRKIEASLIG